MNISIISAYLQFLRKSHNYTQEDPAKRLDIARQAVSKWETGTTIPEDEVFPDTDYHAIRNTVGRVRIETVEDMQNQIVSLINLQTADR